MSKTTKVVQDVELKAVPLPVKTETYTVISHGFIIDEVKRELAKAGFEVMAEEYRANNNLEVARGSYIIKRSEDPSFLMSFNWTNSYDKSTKFQCAVGGYVWENNAFVIEKEGNSFIRKHTGDADTLVKETIADKIANAEAYYHSVLQAKQAMQHVKVSRGQVSKILGDLYFNFDMISIEQLSGIKKEYQKPSYVYSTDSDSLWTIYCHILTVLKSSHPKVWLLQQGFVHNYLKMNYLTLADPVITPVPTAITDALLKAPEVTVDPAQINLLDAIEEVEAEGKNVPEEKIPNFPMEDDVVFYTDPLGVTFEAPVVESSTLEDDFTTEEVQEIEEIKESWTPRDESNDLLISDPNVISVLQNEVNNIFGYEIEIEVYEDGENYNIVTGDGQEVTVPIDYVKNLI